MTVYEYVIVLKPTTEEKKKGESAKIIAGPKAILAPDDKSAAMLAGREIPDDLTSKIDRMEISIRPF